MRLHLFPIAVILTSVVCLTTARAALLYTANETSDGIRFVVVAGKFEYSDNLDQFTASVRSNNATVVVFDSPGGSIEKAIELGRLIRSLKLNTLQFRRSECSSACALAFFGGVIRFAEPGAIGVHKSFYDGEAAMTAQEAVSAIQKSTAEVITYMVDMGVEPALLKVSLAYESDDIRYLSKSEMEQYKVVTKPPAESGEPVTPSMPAQPPASTSLDQAPVSVAGRKPTIFAIPGDSRQIGWVYINACSIPSSVSDQLRRKINDQTFTHLRLVPAQVAYFDARTRSECTRKSALVPYLHSRAQQGSGVFLSASSELLSILSPYGITTSSENQNLSGPVDDNYRFDIWLTAPTTALLEPVPPGSPALVYPEARSGLVRHADGAAPIKVLPDPKAANFIKLRNGAPVTILSTADRWYRVKAGGQVGYMHHTWIFIDQYERGSFDERYVQVKSFDNLADAEAFARSALIPLSAHLATNGWFAVTLRGTYDESTAVSLAKEMKARGAIPEDSFITYGNTYVRRVCCG